MKRRGLFALGMAVAVAGCEHSPDLAPDAGVAIGPLLPVHCGPRQRAAAHPGLLRLHAMPAIDFSADATIPIVGDFNGDGPPDLLFVEQDHGQPILRLLGGNGDGTFAPARTIQSLPGGLRYDRSLKALDVNGDGWLDAVTNSGVYPSLVLRNSGHGAFHEWLLFATGVPVAGDFDGDHHTDLALVDGNHIQLAFGYGADQDGYSLGSWPLASSAIPHVLGVLAGDLDGDGRDELITSTYDLAPRLPGRDLGDGGDGSVQFQVWSADHKRILSAAPLAPPPGGEPAPWALGDMDGDGHLDLLVRLLSPCGLDTIWCGASTLLKGTGDRRFAPAADRLPVTSNLLGDADGDGIMDLIEEPNDYFQIRTEVAWLRGQGDWKFQRQPATIDNVAELRRGAQWQVVTDLDCDGYPDLVRLGHRDRSAQPLLNLR